VEGKVAKLFGSYQGGITVYQFDDSQQYCYYYYYYYAHLDRYAPGLKEGTLLRQGQVLGYLGSTGDAQPSGPHLALRHLPPRRRQVRVERHRHRPRTAAAVTPAVLLAARVSVYK
jgi:murein DD-endopeptidase MepM/ murein hydrolase activator NlpD